MDVTVTLPSGRRVRVPRGLPVGRLFDRAGHEGDGIIGARLNNEIVSLTYRASVNCTIEPITLPSPDGKEIYRRTLVFALQMAAREVLQQDALVIGHSLASGYYHTLESGRTILPEECVALERRLREIVDADLPIERGVISYQDAVRCFEERGQPRTVLLLRYQNRSKVPIYSCGAFLDLSHGPLLPRTGMLRFFEVRHYPPGLLLRYPDGGDHTSVPPFQDDHLLFSIYREHSAWEKFLRMNCVGRLNQIIDQGEVRDLIHVAEALQNKKIGAIADQIAGSGAAGGIVLIAGPSSSGKTTLAKKLAIQMRALGMRPVPLSLDDYFLSRDLTPVDADGKPDFEALEAVDVPLLNRHLTRLMAGEQVRLPRFDFVQGRRIEGGRSVSLDDQSLLIIEGIHGLNDRLTADVPRERKYKIYVSAITQLNLDAHARISTTDNRLIRRLVRDHKYRGHSALETLRMWPSVRRGEDRNIFPFQNDADAVFNSALVYELAVLKVFAELLLRTVKPDQPEYSVSRRLLYLLSQFSALPPTWVPSESILREFIGGSEFRY